ncbi:MAG: nucleotidyltransferase domain-containing protein [Natrialbaceae archaeon]|nr:nucleotidyltransferase domain-containing protein [Natrialbaceae archaeon]
MTQLGLVETRRRGNRKEISIDRERVHKPDDPILAIPQESFRTPVTAFLDAVTNRQENLVGIVLFGSVASGDADRASDIDLFIVVEDELMAARRSIHDIRQDVSTRSFDGDRYEFQVLVESVTSAAQHGEKLQEIFATGITLYETDQLETVRGQVLHGR